MIAPGSRLGPYEIVSRLGAGGMGEVYRARDTRLDRSVAIKVLPPNIAREEQARARFEREARAISALNHPNICTLFDVGNENGVAYLVMELIEGPTLAELLARGALPLHDALRYAIDIATALDRAHRQGIVHRDLKPGNVMITKSGLKLLDFGLARLEVRPDVTHDAPTIVNPITTDGMILGTLQYMSPEQLEGHATDARTDIFSFGCILYEMVTGRRAFSGGSQASIISAIMTGEPPAMTTLAPVTPTLLERLVKKCLAKSADDRWQSAGDLATELRWITEEPSIEMIVQPRRKRIVPWVIAAVLLLALIALAAWTQLHRTTSPPAARLSLPLDADALTGSGLQPGIAISPDGTAIVYAGSRGGTSMLWYRPLAELAATPIPNSENGMAPAWSPDGREIAFLANGKLRRTTPRGERASIICDVKASPIFSMDWGEAGIVWAGDDDQDALMLVSPAGGPPRRVKIAPVSAKHWISWPRFDQSGHILYTVLGREPGLALRRVSIDGEDDRAIGNIETRFELVGDSIVFGREGSLYAQRIDSDARRSGEPVLLARDVYTYMGVSDCAFSASPSGIVYIRAGTDSHPTWFDTNGLTTGTIGPAGASLTARISHDGRKVVAAVEEPTTGMRQLWICDVAHGTALRVTSDDGDHEDPVFSPDDTRLAFGYSVDGPPQVAIMPATGGPPTRITPPAGPQDHEDWSRDGRFIMYDMETPGTRTDLWFTTAQPGAQPQSWLQTPFAEGYPRFSPDGRWVAYVSNESGKDEVYAAQFDKPLERVQISNGGGAHPVWSPNGREMYYNNERKLYAVPITYAAASLERGEPRVLFSDNAADWTGIDITPDGKRFLVRTVREQGAEAPLVLVTNWQALFK